MSQREEHYLLERIHVRAREQGVDRHTDPLHDPVLVHVDVLDHPLDRHRLPVPLRALVLVVRHAVDLPLDHLRRHVRGPGVGRAHGRGHDLDQVRVTISFFCDIRVIEIQRRFCFSCWLGWCPAILRP